MIIGNLPRRNDEYGVRAEVTEHGNIRIMGQSTIEELSMPHNTHQGDPLDRKAIQCLGDKIAYLVLEARDAGFRHGQEYIRNALGITK